MDQGEDDTFLRELETVNKAQPPSLRSNVNPQPGAQWGQVPDLSQPVMFDNGEQSL